MQIPVSAVLILIISGVLMTAEVMKPVMPISVDLSSACGIPCRQSSLWEEQVEMSFSILMDVMMPVMDGIAATKAIRAMDRPDAKTIPIIAMTANAFEEDAKRCFAAGMTAHLAKPFQIEDVEKTIVECCGK